MLPIVQRSLPLAHQFDFATPPDAGYWKFGARDSQACLDVRFWHKADMSVALSDACFWGKADIPCASRNVT